MTIKINNGIVKFELVNPEEEARPEERKTSDKETTLKKETSPEVNTHQEMPARPAVLSGKTYEIHNQQQTVFITINNQLMADGQQRPYEILINTNQAQGYSGLTAIARLSSRLLQQGVALADIADQLGDIFDPSGGFTEASGEAYSSLIAAIAQRLKQHQSDW